MAAKKAKKGSRGPKKRTTIANLKGQAKTLAGKISSLFQKVTGGVTASATKRFVSFHFTKEDGALLQDLCKKIAKTLPKNEVLRGTANIKILINPVGRPAVVPAEKRKVINRPKSVVKKLTRGNGYMRAAA
jgi:hypothetical protein